jgi:microcystin-dependent protein
MSVAYIAEIRIFGFNFAPVDWAVCAGQTIDISQNTTLFQIIGTTYGGNGQTTFNLPQFQDRTVVGAGQGPGLRNWPLGGAFGEPNHTLLITEVPLHSHSVLAGSPASAANLSAMPTSSSYFSHSNKGTRADTYSTSATTTLAGTAIGISGSSVPHPNIQPVLAMNYCISLFGVFPSQN